jgi:hypothetical protein
MREREGGERVRGRDREEGVIKRERSLIEKDSIR